MTMRFNKQLSLSSNDEFEAESPPQAANTKKVSAKKSPKGKGPGGKGPGSEDGSSYWPTPPPPPPPPQDYIDFPVSASFRNFYALQGLTYPSGRPEREENDEVVRPTSSDKELEIIGLLVQELLRGRRKEEAYSPPTVREVKPRQAEDSTNVPILFKVDQ